MAKAYWIATYQAVHDESKLTAYANLAGPASSKGTDTLKWTLLKEKMGNPSRCNVRFFGMIEG